MAEIIAQDGDITMPELSAALFDATRVQAPPNAIGKVIGKLGYTHKKVTGAYREKPESQIFAKRGAPFNRCTRSAFS